MAFLEQDAKPLTAGWGPPQQLHAPDIGSTLAAILNNRRLQQQQTQEALTAAIKAQQDRNSSAAYIQAAQNAGVLPQGDYSGMSEKAASDLAQRIQDQTPDTDVDALHQAMARYYNAGADLGGRGSYRGGARGGSMVTVTDENGDPVLGADGNPVQVPAGSRLGQQIVADQGNITTPPSASVASAIAAKMNLPPQSITDTAQHQGMGYVPGGDPGWAKGQTGPVDQQGNPTNYLPVSPGDEPTDIKVSPTGTDPKTQQPYQPVIVQRDTLEQLRRALQGRSYRPQRSVSPNDVDQAAQAQGLQPGPSAPPPASTATPTATPPPYSQSIPTPTPPQGTQPTVLQLRQQAQDAIANGKDPEAVKQRFHELTGGQL
jgi:hypothetical protein